MGVEISYFPTEKKSAILTAKKYEPTFWGSMSVPKVERLHPGSRSGVYFYFPMLLLQ